MTDPSSNRQQHRRQKPLPVQTGPSKLHPAMFIRSRGEFSQVRAGGQTRVYRSLVLNILEAPDGRLKLGIIVSRKYDRQAVQRNRARRLIREAYRLTRSAIIRPVWLVAIARRSMHGCKVQHVQADLMHLLSRADLLADIDGNQ